MQLAELFHGLDHFTRKQSHQTGDHPGELAVAVAELLRPVQLVEKEPGRRPVARRGQQVGIAHFEAPGLVGLDRLHPLGQRGVGTKGVMGGANLVNQAIAAGALQHIDAPGLAISARRRAAGHLQNRLNIGARHRLRGKGPHRHAAADGRVNGLGLTQLLHAKAPLKVSKGCQITDGGLKMLSRRLGRRRSKMLQGPHQG